MEISALAAYRPAWGDAKGRRRPGPDEDVATLAISAGRSLADRLSKVGRVVLVSRRPAALLGTAPEVVLEALGLDGAIPFVEQIGGAPATLEALLTSEPGTLILAVDPSVPAAATAAVVGPGGLRLTHAGTVRHSVPVRTVPLPGATELVYDDPRLLRERGWKRAVCELAAEHALAVAGVPLRDAAKLVSGATGVAETEAAAPVLLLAYLAASQREGRLVALENGHAVAVDVALSGPIPVVEEQRVAHNVPPTWDSQVSTELPASPAAYERAFEAKVGFRASVCGCGAWHYPPRAQCTACGALKRQYLEVLPRDASVYSVVTVRAAVPGKRVPYSLAVVDVADTGLRVLAHVTDYPPGEAPIGATGRLVLRKVAVRAGIPDYGYAFQPDEKQS